MRKLTTILLLGFIQFIGFSQIEEVSLSKNIWSVYDTVLEEPSLNRDINSVYPPSKYHLSTTIPKDIHTALFENKIIEDPFYGNNEQDLQWIEEKDWKYETTFYLSKKQLQHEHIDLIFEGLDTYAKVYLNGNLIIEANNMFRQWQANIKFMNIAKKGENKLEVIFQSAEKKAKVLSGKSPYTLPGEERVYVRKAQYQFGWDWSPRFVTCGIWKDVKLKFWDNAIIENVHVIQDKLSEDKAELSIVTNTYFNNIEDVFFKTSLYFDGKLIDSKKTELTRRETTINFTIDNPKLWWSNGLGKQNLYEVKTELIKKNKTLQTVNHSFGLRTIELVQEKDSVGSSFYFKLNDVPVFCKGANMIPLDFFPSNVTIEVYENLIKSALDANMNMLRVWGGGIYEDDTFYELCDKYGILVWQDFMFACAMYPGDYDFTHNVKKEVSEQIIRLRNHPSIALWCGNNENSEGWNNWGWQKQYNYSEKDSTEIINNYHKLFLEIIPNEINRLDNTRAYHPSSPETGWGRKESLLKGDVHYWGVWWGLESFKTYEEKVGRFVSEYGFQGMPSMESFKKFIPENELALNSPSVKNHQKHPTGYQTIDNYLQQHFIKPNDFGNYSYISQLTQAYGIETAINAHRKAMPYCMGSLYWQLNDCWPVTSWSSIDYYNIPKALHYKVKNAFNPISIISEVKGSSFNIFIVSDLQKELATQLKIEHKQLGGKPIFEEEKQMDIHPNQSFLYHKIPFEKIQQEGVIKLSIYSKDVLIQEKYVYLKEPKDLILEKPDLSIDKINGNTIKITCNNYLAKDIYLQHDNIIFNDNFFDLLPGESKIITFNNNTLFDINKLKIKTLFNTLQP